MAMDGDILGDAMKAAVDALSDADKADRVKVFRAMGAAVVAHIQNHAVVSTTGTTASACTAGGATGTCSSSGTIA